MHAALVKLMVTNFEICTQIYLKLRNKQVEMRQCHASYCINRRIKPGQWFNTYRSGNSGGRVKVEFGGCFSPKLAVQFELLQGIEID